MLACNIIIIIVVVVPHLAAVDVVVHHVLTDDHPSLCVTTWERLQWNFHNLIDK